MKPVKKTMAREEWSRIVKREYTYKNYENEDFCGAVGLLRLLEVTKPLWVRCGDKEVKVVDNHYQWLQFAFQNKNYWLTVMLDDQEQIVEYYFDITAENRIEPNGKSWFIDMFLDVVRSAEGEIYLLDEDELEEALSQNEISQKEYAAAYETARALMKDLSKPNDLQAFCMRYYRELKELGMIEKVELAENILLQVEKPARYTGGEVNMCEKDLDKIQTRFALCFPDVYEVGMSNLGMQILYYFLNRRADCYCERVFSPWVDMEDKMRENNIPLFSLETKTPIRQFDFLGITLQYEMSYTNVLRLLDLAQIPLLAKDRTNGDPLVIAGGPCAYNPEPLAAFVDFFYIGEGEAKLDEIMDLYKQEKDRAIFLEKVAQIKGIYVPRFYDVTYDDQGKIASFTPNNPNAPQTIEKVIAENVDTMFVPTDQIVPFIEVVHDRVALELFRGCIRGCRFCQAGFIYRPVREKSVQTLRDQSEKLLAQTGHDEVSLLSLSTSDYSEFPMLVDCLMDDTKGEGVSFSLPSLRVDSMSLAIMERAQGVRKSSLTFAPEAGTQRLRDVINKGISETEILEGCYLAFSSGWDKVKLYFMIGLPTETTEDLEGIAVLADKIVEKFYELPKEKRPRPVSVSISASAYVPKPFTPFQWEAQNTAEEFRQKQGIVKKRMTKKQIKFHYHDAKTSIIEGVLARGDRKLADVLVRVVKSGARFEGWSEFFDYTKWENAFAETGLSMEMYTRQRDIDEILPWGHINIGVSNAFFIKERENAYNEATTPNCKQQCTHCGAAKFHAGICVNGG